MKLATFFFGVFSSISVGASEPPAKKTCPDLTGSYEFDGQWESFEVDGVDSVSIRHSVLEVPPRFDERALSIFARSVIGPRVVVAKHEVTSGTLVIDILGAGIDNQWKLYGPFLPASISLKCADGRWLRETVALGKGGFASTESRNQIYLQMEANGDLKAEGQRSRTKGLIFQDKLIMRWTARFRKSKEK